MKVCIHRGTHEIGGTCIELESQGKRLVLDLGLPLGDTGAAARQLPPVPGLTTGDDDTLLGIVISHPHQDHWGLLPEVHPSVPVFIGEAAARILDAATFFGPSGITLKPQGFLRHHKRFELGPFTLTPHLNDHSGYDAYSLLIEADGRRVFYTGDLRGHGRKASLFDQLVAKPPMDVDVLLMEGTTVSSEGGPERRSLTEAELEDELIEPFRPGGGMVLVGLAAQNIDRLVTVYKAALRAGRELVVDLYTATIAQATGRESIPKPGHDKLRVFVPQSQRARVKRAGAFARTKAVEPWRIYPEELAERRDELVMLFRASMAADLERAGGLDGARLVWSLWPGYLDDGNERLKGFLSRHGIPVEVHHTSGHASVEDLGRLAAAMAPRRVVPIHTFAPERFDELFPRVERHPDSLWWEV